MQTKPLLYGLIGFFIGGFIVAVAATTFDKSDSNTSKASEMSMSDMTTSLKGKAGDDFDKAFLNEMIAHHKGAVAMAQLASKNAKHDEVKQLSKDIITAQDKEIEEMILWQTKWGYAQGSDMTMMNH